MDLSQLVVERNTLFSCIVPTVKHDDNRLQTLNCLYVMFNNYLIKLKESKETIALSKYPELVMVIRNQFEPNHACNKCLFSFFLLENLSGSISRWHTATNPSDNNPCFCYTTHLCHNDT